MAEPDYTLAAQIKGPVAKDPLEMALGLERYNLMRKENYAKEIDNRQKQIDFDALARYKQTRSPMDLEGATPDLRHTTLASDAQDQAIKKDVMSRDANYIQSETNPEIKKYLWQKKGEEYVRKGWVPKDVWDKHKDTPNDDILGNIIRGNMGVSEFRTTTGQAAGAEAAGRAPYDVREQNPMNPLIRPGVRPGGSVAAGSPVGNPFGGLPVEGPAPSNTGPRPPGTVNLTDTNATVLPGVPGTPSAQPGRNIRAVDKTNPYASEVPEVKIGQDLPTGRGVVNQGIDPLRAKARTEGLDLYNKDIEPNAAAAAKTRAELGTMKAELDKGVTTDRLAELKTSIAGFIYGVTKDPRMVNNLTGLDISNQEVFNKESTRMGLTFARQTEGAREAVAAIRIALGANPSLLNTEAGNRKIIAIMDQAAKYDQERSKAAQAYMQKNDGHLTGFDTWFSQTHSPAAFISKAVPYRVPPGGMAEMQPGVTYEWDNGTRKGVWDGEHFTPNGKI